MVGENIFRLFGNTNVANVLRMSSRKLSTGLNKSISEILAMKAQILRKAKPSLPPPLPSAPLRNITGVRIASTYPDPNSPRVLLNLLDPKSMQQIASIDLPNVIEVDFNARPDAGTLSTSTFFVTKNGASVNTQLIQVTSATARLIITDTIEPNTIYTVVLKGTGATPIKFNGKTLDGDPLSLPSGDGIEGGDFTFAMRVNAPIQPPAVPTMPSTLIKVIGARIRTNQPTVTTLSELIDPKSTQYVNYQDTPNIVEVDFNVIPDGGTLTTSTFLITTDAGSVPATLTNVSATTARLTMTGAVEPGTVYTVRVVGTGATPVKYQTRVLDGEPLTLPSGNNIEGGDFTFTFKVSAAPVPPPPALVLAKVIGMRLSTSVPNPGTPRILHEVISTGGSHQVYSVDLPDIVEFDFNVVPDPGTVTTSTVTVQGPSGAVTGTVTNVVGTKYRFKSTTALAAGSYSITLSGTGATSIKFNSKLLDGESTGLPSGDGIEGGNFILNFSVI